MPMLYDSHRPAAGVLVLPVPRPKISGMNYTQARNMRKLDFDFSVMSPKPMVQPVKTSGGGLPPSVVVAKGDARSHNHRRRSPKMRAHNRCFGPALPETTQYLAQDRQGKLRQLRGMLVRIKKNGMRVDARLDASYERVRASYLSVHFEFRHDLVAMERQVENTVR